jgi:hypothetical protein
MTAYATHSPSRQQVRGERRSRNYGHVGTASELRADAQPAPATIVDSRLAALHDALQEIALIEQRLRALGDVASLRRFGEAEAGVSIAGSVGHLLLSTGEARTVDRLSRMPGGITLVRTYLELCGVPHLCELGGTEMTVEQNDETTTEGHEGAIDEEAVRERAYELSQSEDAGTPDENWYRAESELLATANGSA